MNIEEKNQAAAIKKAGKLLGHFPACGTARGTPGHDAPRSYQRSHAQPRVAHTRAPPCGPALSRSTPHADTAKMSKMARQPARSERKIALSR